MTIVKLILGILAVAVITALLYLWGLKKSMSKTEDLDRILLGKSADRVIRFLKKNSVITEKEVAIEVKGVRAGLFWSKDRAEVQDPEKFAPKLLRYMVEQQRLESVGNGKYRLRK